MAARLGMANLIQRLRAMGNVAGTAFVVEGVEYFDDVTLQDVLDRHRCDLWREPLQYTAVYDNGGTAHYHDYYFEYDHVEEALSGTTAWDVETAGGSAIGTANYTVNYHARHIRFSADQGGSAYVLSYRSFDMERAAAEVWEMKAGMVADRAFDVQSDNHVLKRSQLRDTYLKMADLYRRRAKPKTIQLIRGDEASWS